MQSTTRPNPYAQQDDAASFDSTGKESTTNLAQTDGMTAFYSEVRSISRPSPGHDLSRGPNLN